MKKNVLRRFSHLFALLLAFAFMLSGCGQPGRNRNESSQPPPPPPVNSDTPNSGSVNNESSSENQNAATELYVRFGDEGAPFTMHLYDNDTAASIARHVGSADWRIPLNHYDDYEGWEVMQYYDIPSRYDIPSNAETVTTQQAGAVYYSEPNRIVLFYGDAEITGEYTQVGYFDVTEEFVSAVESNPVLEGWENKIIHISAEV